MTDQALLEKFASNGTVSVNLSHELVALLSEQLYQSPYKAIEELVVNAYDADANSCRVFVPEKTDPSDVVAVFDDGNGMDLLGLQTLWQVGRIANRVRVSSKGRAQVGKFGIGKLATYALGRKLTYVSKSKGQILGVSVDFEAFQAVTSVTSARPIVFQVYTVPPDSIYETDLLVHALDNLGIDPAKDMDEKLSWTLAIIQDLKPSVRTLRRHSLMWVLSTAMPRNSRFSIFYNKEKVKNTKDQYVSVANFDLGHLPEPRLTSISANTDSDWTIDSGSLVSRPDFGHGIKATVEVTEKTLSTGKSSQIGRSNGFFVRVRGRLINETDPEFGLSPLPPQVFNRFVANVEADDLDEELSASRESLKSTPRTEVFRTVLLEIFKEARSQYERFLKKKEEEELHKKEHERRFVSKHLVEHPVADILMLHMPSENGAEADGSWFYLDLDPSLDSRKLALDLYQSPLKKYRYRYLDQGSSSRLVRFNPEKSEFTLNSAHPFVREYLDDHKAVNLLEDFATAEVLLEVYLQEHRIASSTIAEILEHRDKLLRALVKDHPNSPQAIARELEDSVSSDTELEIALVAAMRCLGFNAKHVSGSGEPDGVAQFASHPAEKIVITLEAKSTSRGKPSLSQLDFAGIQEHQLKHGAKYTLLVSPDYPGNNEHSAVATRARQARISCWRISDLAEMVRKAESFHVSANDIIGILDRCHAPDDVSSAVKGMLSETKLDKQRLYQAVVEQLRKPPRGGREDFCNPSWLQGRLQDELDVELETIRQALRELAGLSRGLLQLRGDSLIIVGDLDELERRLGGALTQRPQSRRPGTFRSND